MILTQRRNRLLFFLILTGFLCLSGTYAAVLPDYSDTNPLSGATYSLEPDSDGHAIISPGTEQQGGLMLTASTEFSNIGENIEMRVRVSGFINIKTFRFSMTWNPTDLQFLNLSNFNVDMTGLDLADFDITQTGAGILTLDWNNATGVGLPDNDVIFRIRFNILDGPGTFPVVFGNDPVAIFAQQAFPPFPLPVSPTDGAIVVSDCMSPLAGMSCETAVLLCNGELDGYCGHTGPDTGLTDPPGFCGSVENGEWISFIAGSTAMTIQVNTGNCTGSTIGSGLQVMSFYTNDCINFTPVSGCITQIEEFSSFDMSLTGMTPGEAYYILFDGYGGDMCDYTLQILTGNVAPGITNPGAVNGQANLCEESTLVPFSIDPVPGALGYIWTVPPGAFVNGSGPSVSVDFGTTSGQVCVRAYDDCDTTASSCVDVTLYSAVTVIDLVTICADECYTVNGNDYCNPGTYNIPLGTPGTCDTILQLNLTKYPPATGDVFVSVCQGDCYTLSGNTFCSPGIYQVVLPDASIHGCDSTVTVHLSYYVAPVYVLDTVICAGSSFVYNQVTYTTTGTYPVVLENASIHNCDSLVEIHLQVIDLNVSITLPDTITCTTPLVTLSGQVLTNPPGLPVIYNWLNSANVSIGNTPNIPVSVAGNYTLQASVTVDGVTCTESANITVQQVLSLPEPLSINGSLTSCIGQPQVYAASFDNTLISYNWTIVGGTILGGDGTDTVIVNWTSVSNPQICVTPFNECGSGTTTCLDITVSSPLATSPISGSTLVCPDDVETYSVVPVPGIMFYQWTIPADAILLSGQTTQQISINWNGSPGGEVCMTPISECGTGPTVCTTVSIINENATFNIAGDMELCQGDTAFYTFDGSGTNFSYQWSVPLGGNIVSGQGTETIGVAWTNSPGGQVCLSVQTACLTLPLVCETVLVNTPPNQVNIQGNSVVCNGFPEVYFVPLISGVTNYFWELPANASFTGQGTNAITVNWSGSADGQVCLTMTNECGIGQQNCIPVEVIDLPATPIVSGVQSVCSGTEVIYTVENAALFDSIHWSVPSGAVILGQDDMSTVTVLWESGIGGDICVDAMAGCDAVVAACLAVIVNALPMPEAGDDQVVCDLNTNLNASTGNGQWTYTTSTGGTAFFTNVNDPLTEAMVTVPGDFQFYWTIENGGCTGADSVMVSFGDQPVISNVLDSCSSDLAEYHIIFEVNGGTAPYTIIAGFGGSFNGNVFTSIGIPSGFNYMFEVEDANGCSAAILSGSHTCVCETQAGTLNLTPINICTGETAIVISNGDYSLDLSDTLMYILHSGTASNIGNIIGMNNSGQFTFQPGVMTAGQTYFVHIVAGNDTGNGVVDASDICYSQSVNGVPVVFFAPPQGMISGDTTICAGETANITFDVSGVFPVTLLYTIAGEQQAPLIFNSSPFTISVTPALTTTYAIFMLTDASLASCTSGGSNQVTVQVLDGTLEADAGSDFLSCDNSTNLQAVLPAGTSGNWTTESAAVIASPGDPQTIVSGLESGANIFIWTITDAICSGVSSSDTMIVYYQQGQLIEDDSFSTLRIQVLEGDVTLNDGLIPGADWTINTLDQPATGVLVFNSDGTFTYTPDGEYSGEVYFSYEICSEECPDICDTAQVEIFIGLEPINLDSILNIPNGITPNGDGANDVFYIDNLAYYPENDIIIFNRWGDIVYKAKPYLNDWNGTSQQGKPLPDGTYYYILRLDIGDGEMYKGDITILKN